MDIISGWRTLPLPSIEKPRPVVEVLMEATVMDIKFNGIRVKVCRISMFEQALCELIVSLLPDCVMGMDIVSNRKYFFYLGL